MRRRRKKQPSRGSGLARALALFAILCGVIAFAASWNVGADSAADAEPEGPDPAAISRAINHLDSASQALDSTNYGRTRFHIHESRRTLADALE